MSKLDDFIFSLNRSIETYGRETVTADEVLELAEAVREALALSDTNKLEKGDV